MAVPIHRKIARWIFDSLLWDTAGTEPQGFWRRLWATRKLVVAVMGSAVLTWREWVEHHPPEIVLLALIHFVFVLAAIAVLVFVWQWFGRRDRAPSGSQRRH
jgi:hypothetical protein